ncbi:MAG: glycosyl transferase family 2 [Chitinophagaceae bacterium]|nr:glycosyl transferase family 2 [Chitinophagaceae bacterium]
MIVFLWCLYILSASVRLIGWLFFRILVKFPQPMKSFNGKEAEGISVVVCAHNNLSGLQQLLPLLVAQDCPLFEIIIVDDRSSDQTADWLAEQAKRISSLKVITITETPENWNAKKYALTQGIKASQYPLLALTDSDCIPLSTYWLFHVAKQLTRSNKSIFLGYSPYEETPGLLNKIIQTETLFTALQYFSMANAGYTYMGVGRNLGYRKSFLEKHLDNFPFQNHVGGDDDLLINQLSTGSDAVISLNPETFVLTFPPKDLKTWWKQKRRHLSAGMQYKPVTRTLLGIYWLSASLFWLAFITLLLLYKGDSRLVLFAVHLSFFAVGTVLLFPVFRIFKAVRLLPLFLFWDFLYIASSSIIGFSTFLVKNKKWS